MDWQDVLRGLVSCRLKHEFAIEVHQLQPSIVTEYSSCFLPESDVLDFYKCCNGGLIDDYLFVGLEDVTALTAKWASLLSDYFNDGSTPLTDGHLVLATDSAGAPLIWDSGNDMVSTFWFKGGDWEPLGKCFSTFMIDLLVDYEREDEADLWADALALASGEGA